MSVLTADFMSGAAAESDAFTDYQLNCPIIGFSTSISGISSSNDDPDFPASNMLNPATHLKWKASNNNVSIFIDTGFNDIDYVAIAGHNLGDVGADLTVYVDRLNAALLHFDGTDGSTTINSNSYDAQVWTAHGNAQIDTAEFKFGSSSLLCDGTGDYVDTPDNDDVFNLAGYDFTIDMWVRPNASGNMFMAGQVDAAGIANADSAWRLRKDASDHLTFAVTQGTTQTTVTGTTTMNNATWYHVAAVRSGDVLYLFLDGVLEGQADFTGEINNSTEPMTVGRAGSQTANTWNGWIDEFHITFGVPWSVNFDPPDDRWPDELLSTQDIGGDQSPIIVRFPFTLTAGIVEIALATDDFASIAVIYVERLLVLERSIALDPDHVPINFGRKTNVVNGMSESGNFLGRIVLSQYSESKATFTYFTQNFFRDEIDDFIIAAKETPFFWAWNPTENPTDVGYAWLTQDPQPGFDPVTRRVSLELNMRAITE